MLPVSLNVSPLSTTRDSNATVSPWGPLPPALAVSVLGLPSTGAPRPRNSMAKTTSLIVHPPCSCRTLLCFSPWQYKGQPNHGCTGNFALIMYHGWDFLVGSSPPSAQQSY